MFGLTYSISGNYPKQGRKNIKEITRLHTLLLHETDPVVKEQIEYQLNMCKCLSWKDYKILFK
ncbi:hypothetical protein CHH57_01750 [Niallia circulans]|uniref:Uncharacterized protein n=1 Tax=Niallia circulans TaxID=1397 RepID=A0AA91Z322_NIACI|nr:hypothetical protein CHH57_01750 [Niallia circulans]